MAMQPAGCSRTGNDDRAVCMCASREPGAHTYRDICGDAMRFAFSGVRYDQKPDVNSKAPAGAKRVLPTPSRWAVVCPQLRVFSYFCERCTRRGGALGRDAGAGLAAWQAWAERGSRIGPAGPIRDRE